MEKPLRQIKLGVFLRPAGHHLAGWRHPEAQADAGVNFQHFVELAQTAERGFFDMLFLADTAAVPSDDLRNISRTSYVSWIEPFTMMAALAPMTRHVGLVCTASTTFDQPYNLARRFASLDLVSGGRGGWNLVTSSNPIESLNYGHDAQVPRDQRYARAREFAEIVRALWDSWDDDAFVRDKQSGVFFDPEKIHVLDHKGKHFSVRGPLNVSRSPQGQPVLVQAGASDDGRDIAAEFADVVFAAEPTLDGARQFYADMKARAAKFGRRPDETVIMPGFQVTLGSSEQEARDRFETLQNLIHPDVGLRYLSQYIHFDLTKYPVDGPLPDISEKNVSRTTLLVNMAKRENLTIRQLYQRMAGGRGHYTIHGTTKTVADQMEEWFTTGGADGFNIMAPVYPGGLDEFVAFVVPELQRRGLMRRAYEGRTLRDNLGLRRRESMHARAPKLASGL
jgi:FMN-dependent oxidoreductase (nitrilotriacetate monooxygenase family)